MDSQNTDISARSKRVLHGTSPGRVEGLSPPVAGDP